MNAIRRQKKLILLSGISGLLVFVPLPGQAQVPIIIKAPQGTSILAGSGLNLNVQASSGTPLAYQWLLNSTPISGATSSSYAITFAQKANAGSYQVALTNNSGTVTTPPAVVNVVTADQTNIMDQLVGHYPFEQTYADVSGRGNSGTPSGTPGWTETGKCGGGAAHLQTSPDGSVLNFVSLAAPDDFAFGTSTNFSISLWVRYTQAMGEFPLIANMDWASPSGSGWGIAAGPDGGVHWAIAGGPGTIKRYQGSPGTLTNGIWHHIAVTFERTGNATTYLDGAVVGTTALGSSANDVSTVAGLSLNIAQDGTGTFTGGGTAGIDVGIDDVGIWQRALTADEVYWIFAKAARSANLEQNVFGIGGAGTPTRITGQWDFDQGDLKATYGQDLEYGDGSGGPMATHTSFGTTTSFGIPDVRGASAHVMKYTRNENPPDNYVQGYTMHHGIAPNGGGTLVNQWTLVADILFPDLHQGDQYSAFIEIQNSVDSDADLAVHEESPGVGGIGISGRYPGNLTQGQWHQVVFAVDMAATPGVITKFIDGVKAADQTDADGSGLDGRFSLSDVAHLFSDGGHDNEVNDYYVDHVQIRDGKLGDAEIVALARGTKITGQWDFDNGDLKATVGQDLAYGDGPGGYMATQTSFGTTTSFGIPDIGGVPAKVMKYTRSENPPDNYVQGYTMHHGIAPNGGGTLVNQWTLIVDILYPDLHQGDQYSAFIEIQNSTDSDADLAVHEESPGVGGIGISGRYPGNLTQGQWHRVAFAVDMAATPGVISKFIDGVKAADQTDADGSGLDGRFALSDVAHLFSDGGHDNEVNTYYVNSVQIRDGKLGDAEINALGGPQASGISGGPVAPISTRPTLHTSFNGTALTVSWDPGVTGFILEATDSLTNPNWSNVPGVVNNSVTVNPTGVSKFYRLRQ
jgi:hypothetical protein